ncbi:MAG: hypothetical protein PUG36_01810 [Clostridiales bacterium]|nr:hypothetical protein [Clostridiales bacterium]
MTFSSLAFTSGRLPDDIWAEEQEENGAEVPALVPDSEEVQEIQELKEVKDVQEAEEVQANQALEEAEVEEQVEENQEPSVNSSGQEELEISQPGEAVNNPVGGGPVGSGPYSLDFFVERKPAYCEDMTWTYSNYWKRQLDKPIFNFDKWALNSFSITHTLHITIGGREDTLVGYITYDGQTYRWNSTKMYFQDIAVPYEQVSVEYYEREGGGYVEPYLLDYDLYLEEGQGEMILKVPKLEPEEGCPFEGPKLIGITIIKPEVYLNGERGDDSKDGTSPESMSITLRLR